MNHNSLPPACPGCEGVERRQFLKASVMAGAAVAASSALPRIVVLENLHASPMKAAAKAASSETLVAALYKSLSEPQRQAVAFEFNHPLRSKIDPTGKSRHRRSLSFLRQTSRP